MLLLILLGLWIGCGWWAGSIMENKGRSMFGGVVLGMTLGIFGVLIAALMSRDQPQQAVVYAAPLQQFVPPAGNSGELERLSKLHVDGRLTDAEYARAKAKVLGLG